MESLLQLPKCAINIGKLGANTGLNSKTSIPTSPTFPNQKKPSSSQDLHRQEHGPGLSATEIRLKFHQSKMRSRPSPRPFNWLDNKVLSTKMRENTFFPSNNALKDSD